MANKKPMTLQERMNKLVELQELLASLSELESLSDIEMLEASPRIAVVMHKIDILGTELGFEETVAETHGITVETDKMASIYRNVKNQMEREERLAKRPPLQDTKMEGTKCINCGKRPARIDQYCKRCAREKGIIVKGKV